MKEIVILPKKLEPKFPARCVVCGKPNENEFTQIQVCSKGITGFVKDLMGKSRKQKVPAHRGCEKKVKRGIFFRTFAVLGVGTVILIVWAIMLFSEVRVPFELSRLSVGLNKLIVILAIIIAVMPIIIWNEFFPAVIDCVESEKIVTFEFKDKNYAAEFARLNNTKIGINDEFTEDALNNLSDIGKNIYK